MEPQNEEALLQGIIEVIEQGSGMVLAPEQVKQLLIEVQHEQLKHLVYQAFRVVTGQGQAPVAAQEEAAE